MAISPICGDAFDTLIRHCPKQLNREGGRRNPLSARPYANAAPSLQSCDAILIELKGRVRTNMMAVSCNDHYDETITVFVHQRSDEPEVRLVVARIQTFNYRLKKGLGIMRHRKAPSLQRSRPEKRLKSFKIFG